MNPALELRALRGATTASANTAEAIGAAVQELIAALVAHNGLEGREAAQLLSITFSVTAALDACFPAAIARRMLNGDGIAMLDCQQMAVQGDLPRCIRLLAHAWLEAERTPVHPYLGEAIRLRPDRAMPPEPVVPPATGPAASPDAC